MSSIDSVPKAILKKPVTVYSRIFIVILFLSPHSDEKQIDAKGLRYIIHMVSRGKKKQKKNKSFLEQASFRVTHVLASTFHSLHTFRG